MNLELAKKIGSKISGAVIINDNFIVNCPGLYEIAYYIAEHGLTSIKRLDKSQGLIETLYPYGSLSDTIDRLISDDRDRTERDEDRKEQKNYNEKNQQLLTRILQELIRLNDKLELKEFVQSLSSSSKSLE